MISKIIQKEKERQEEFGGCRGFLDKSVTNDGHIWKCGQFKLIDGENIKLSCNPCVIRRFEHKQSLINLKEYLEEEVKCWHWVISPIESRNSKVIQIQEDIKALGEMIARYEA
ncbi:MAG: hypothetical protein ACTSWD_04840 [Candidatus Heimdallarchaeota archaeon]